MSTLRFPLLSKELYELSSRRRTYIVRFVYGFILFSAGLVILYGRGVESRITEGQGRVLFNQIVTMQCISVLILMPAMMCGSLSGEKERETLPLLLLTTMPGWSILLQKLLSRAIPMLCFVSLSFPLMAAAYAFGGVATATVYVSAGMLLLSVIQVGSISLMASAFCRTTVEAFVMTYLILISLLTFAKPCVPIHGFLPNFASGEIQPLTGVEAAARGHLAIVCSILAFAAATGWLHSRAFVPPRNFLLQLFQALDGFFNNLNSVTGGVVLVDDVAKLPTDKPIAWRETTKKSLGTFRYLFRVLTVLELPILFVSQLVRINSIQSVSAITSLLYLLCIVSVALLCVHAASVVSSERSRQTLDVLLTTPITSQSILLEKMAGVRRLVFVLFVPFLTIFVFQHWFRDYQNNVTYLIESILLCSVLLWTIAWLGMFFGLRNKSQLRAIVTTMIVVLLWCAVPEITQWMLTEIWHRNIPEAIRPVWAISPSLLFRVVETPLPVPAVPIVELWYGHLGIKGVQREILIGSFIAVYAGIGWCLRASCLANADRLLGRVSRGSKPAAATEETTAG